MLTLDAQVHAYERNHPGRPWLGTLYGPAEVTGDQMVAAMDAVGDAGEPAREKCAIYRVEEKEMCDISSEIRAAS
jgi:L-fuconolactonase